MAMLDIMRKIPELEVVVAHFDHGIRDDSYEDVRLVREVASKHGLAFETRREALGEGASEALARERRYAFLRELAAKYDADIYTAHHDDDAVETVAINLVRGTGWRGLATLDSDVVRPMLGWSKQEIIDYAQANGLSWREDSTNQLETYLRNRVRNRLKGLQPAHKTKLLRLRERQIALKEQITREVTRLVGDGPAYNRHFFIAIDERVALECLRHMSDARLTRPQLHRLLIAIKTAKPGSTLEPGPGVKVSFTSRNFTIELVH